MAESRPRLQDLALLILRVSGLYLAVGHGWAKFSSLVTGNGSWVVDFVARLGFPAPTLFAWALGITEFIGGLCIALGFGTRLFAAMAAFAMFVAAFVSSSGTPAPRGLDGARIVLFMLFGLGLTILGPGRLSLDRILADRGR